MNFLKEVLHYEHVYDEITKIGIAYALQANIEHLKAKKKISVLSFLCAYIKNVRIENIAVIVNERVFVTVLDNFTDIEVIVVDIANILEMALEFIKKNKNEITEILLEQLNECKLLDILDDYINESDEENIQIKIAELKQKYNEIEEIDD